MRTLPIRIVFFTFIVFFTLSSFSCESSKLTTESATTISMNQISISYTGMSGFEQHQINQNEVITSTKGRGETTADAKKEISNKNWKQLNQLVSQLDLTKFETWESPTQERFHDGARATIITIDANGQTYTSQAFDEGNPPAALNDIYKYLESITKS